MSTLPLYRIRVFLFLVVFSCILAHGDEHRGVSPLHDSKITHDMDHLKQHLRDEIELKDAEMSDEDLNFHYFRLHDYDENRKLDGLELMKAISHYDKQKESGQTDEEQQYRTDETMADLVDRILSEDDQNNDGYIDYPEYIASQKNEEAKAAIEPSK